MATSNTTQPSHRGDSRNGQGRAYFTSKSGKRFYARDYGYKCWPIGGKPNNAK